MKKIKPVVLKDAAKLTREQMKNIVAGDSVIDYPHFCFTECPAGYEKSSVTIECVHPYYCRVHSGVDFYGLQCSNYDGTYIYETSSSMCGRLPEGVNLK